jgi:ankyrin repeat protein
VRPGKDVAVVAYLDTEEPVAVAAVEAIHSGDVDGLRRLLTEHPGLATAGLGTAGAMSRTLLHVVTDWPGHFPNGPQMVQVLVAAGADVNGRFEGPHTETPLHWAASSDDVAVLDALLDAGADIEADGAVIGGGTAISDACAFGQWNAARRLVERGASTRMWEAASLGLMDRITRFFEAHPAPSQDQVTEGLWAACHGGQLEAAQFFLAQGADLNWVGYDRLTPLDAARRAGADDVVDWLVSVGARPTR